MKALAGGDEPRIHSHRAQKRRAPPSVRPSLSSGGRIRTCDLRVMSPTSYRTAPPRVGSEDIAEPDCEGKARMLAAVAVVALVIASCRGLRRPARAGGPDALRAASPRSSAEDSGARRAPSADEQTAASRGAERLEPRWQGRPCSRAEPERLRALALRRIVRSDPRVAVADLGTNSTRLLIADVADGHRRRGRAAARDHPARRGRRRERRARSGGDGSRARRASIATPAHAGAGRRSRASPSRRAPSATPRTATSSSTASSGSASRPRVLTGREEAAATFAGVASDMAADGDRRA